MIYRQVQFIDFFSFNCLYWLFMRTLQYLKILALSLAWHVDYLSKFSFRNWLMNMIIYCEIGIRFFEPLYVKSFPVWSSGEAESIKGRRNVTKQMKQGFESSWGNISKVFDFQNNNFLSNFLVVNWVVLLIKNYVF